MVSKDAQQDGVELAPRGKLFAWGVVITVLLGLNIGSWVFCSMIFEHPEHPFSYRLLTRMDKLDPVTGFRATTVPPGKFHTAKDLYSIAYPFSKSQLRAYNGMLKRNYLWNYRDHQPATFIFGKFVVEEVRPLGNKDLFVNGVLVRAVADRFPDAVLELILPTTEPVPKQKYYQKGESLEVGKSDMAAVVLHAKRFEQDRITFLAVPLITKDGEGGDREFQTPSGTKLFLLTPQRLNLQASDL